MGLLVAAGAVAAFVLAGRGRGGAAGGGLEAVHRIVTVRVGEVPRAFWLHAPASRARPAALVVDLHGLGSSALQQAQLSRFDELADREGFVVARPEGTGGQASFNAGACCGEAVARNVDDVGLVRAVLDAVSREVEVDPKRVFAAGFSNGGFLAQRLACELSDRVAAVASVGGGRVLERCEPARPVSVLELHGTEDHHVGYAGGGLAPFAPVEATMHDWAVRQRCAGVASEWAADRRETLVQRGAARCERYAGCADGVEVALCRLEGAGHTWPGGPEVEGLGKVSRDLDATEEIWRFFARHGR